MYQEMRDLLNDWIGLLELDCTTCPETPKEARSECHAWSALPMYEMIRTIAGIIPDEIGWKHVIIEPHMMDLNDLSGSAATPYGTIDFQYEQKNDRWEYELKIPSGIHAIFRFKDGTTQELTDGETCHLTEVSDELTGF